MKILEVKMKVQLGEIIMDAVVKQEATGMLGNKTRKYLLPCLKEYGEEFIAKLNSVYKEAAGIGDMVIENLGIQYEKHLFVLCDTSRATQFFIDFLEWIKDQPMYEDDYVFGDIQKSRFHMIIIKLPTKFNESIEVFKKGKYSEMFSADTIEKFFTVYPDTKGILIKDKNYRIEFVGKLNQVWGTWLKPSEWDGEYDFPPAAQQEIFNHHLKKRNE